MTQPLYSSYHFGMGFSYSSYLSRRTAMKLAAASAVLASCAPVRQKQDRHVAVIGGGIIGTSIAYHLAKEGIRVTLIEKDTVCTRASRGTFAWINATWAKQPRHYHSFSQKGLTGWKRVQSELDIPIRWEGSLEWFPSDERQVKLAKQIQEQVDWGEPAKMVALKELTALEPNVDFGDIKQVAFSPNDGAVNPILASQKFTEAARLMGTIIKTNCFVRRVEAMSNGRSKLLTSTGDIVVDKYVVATGANEDAPKRLAGISIPQRSTPGVIAISKPYKRLINRIIVAPGVHIHQREDGRIVLGEQAGAPNTMAHAERLKGRPNLFPNESYAQQHAKQILAIAEQYVPEISKVEIEDVYIGWRPLPVDGHPVLGPSESQPNAYLAIMHSGVSLAPIVGEFVAKEIATDLTIPNLENYRPNRSFETIKRY